MTTDEEAEAFLDQDLSDLDFNQFKRTHFTFIDHAAPQKRRGTAKTRSGADVLPAAEPVRLKSRK
jgi:hypothetical protein